MSSAKRTMEKVSLVTIVEKMLKVNFVFLHALPTKYKTYIMVINENIFNNLGVQGLFCCVSSIIFKSTI